METALCRCLVQPALPFVCPISESVMHPKISDDLKETRKGSFSATGMVSHMFTLLLSQVPVLALLLDFLQAEALDSQCLGSLQLHALRHCCGGSSCRENPWVGEVTEA